MALRSVVSPADLGVNIHYRDSSVTHPRVRAAQDWLTIELKERMSQHGIYKLPKPARVELYFHFPTRGYDLDGPVKRTIDAIETAAKAQDIDWNDNWVTELFVRKRYGHLPDKPMSIIIMEVDDE